MPKISMMSPLAYRAWIERALVRCRASKNGYGTLWCLEELKRLDGQP